MNVGLALEGRAWVCRGCEEAPPVHDKPSLVKPSGELKKEEVNKARRCVS
jgi:hypothetical protein